MKKNSGIPPQTPTAQGEYYYNDLLHQNLNPDKSVHEDEEEDTVIKISDTSEQRGGCLNRIKSIVRSEKFIVVISKLVVILTGMVGPLFLFVQNDSVMENQTFFGKMQLNRNDFPFQKVFFRYLVLVAFFFYKSSEELQPKNSRDFISGEESKQLTIKEHAVLGLLDFIQVQCFVFSLGYTSILRAYLFGSIQLFILLHLKRREGIQIYTSEKVAFLMALAAQVTIVLMRVDELQKEESFIYGDLVSLLGGIVGSLAFYKTDYKQKNYYNSLYLNHLFSLGISFFFVIFFDTSGFVIDFDNIQNILLLLLVGCFECVANVKKIKTFVFMKYFKNIFEPIVGFKFEFLFGLVFLDTWTILIIYLVLYVPANIIMLSKHADDIRNNIRYRDSTFVDVLNFEEYIEMKEIESPTKVTKNKSTKS